MAPTNYIIEHRQASPTDALPDLTASLNSAIARMRLAGGVEAACQTATDEARRLTGFDRVTVYKFKEDGSGVVIAESLGGDFEPLLGARFPASNIPQHLMSIPITNNDRMWGLVMFHHHTGVKRASYDAHTACEIMAHCLSLQISAKEEAENRKNVARIVRLNAELERSNIELDSFAYVASHDLKESLRGIHKFSNFLIEDYADKLDEAGMEKLRTLVKLAERLEALVDSLLHFSRAGRADLAMREVDLDKVLSETLELLAPQLRESGAEIRRPRRLPVIRADYARVGEIFHNLITNAIKYNDKPLKWVEIGWKDEDGSGKLEMENEGLGIVDEMADGQGSPCLSHPPLHDLQSPVFYVRDNGIGIPERYYETVFDIFRRLHERDEFGGGVGAGLTIVKKIVERHNGRIWIESRVGVGTTVYFTLN